MSSALQVASMSLGNEMVLKAQAFKELGALCETGLFAVKSFKEVVAICWMADAVGAHPMVALQNAYVVKGKVGFDWRFKWGLIKSKLPGVEYEVVEGLEAVVRLASIGSELPLAAVYEGVAFGEAPRLRP